METPKTLLEATRFFVDKLTCIRYIADLRWPNGIVCPKCGCNENYWLATRLVWKCKGCRKQFSVKVGTIFEDSPLPLDKWLIAVWLIVNARNGCSSYELARALGVTQKSAWFMEHRIRFALHAGSFDKKLEGEIEADESFIGGKVQNMHPHKRGKTHGYMGKSIVVGLL